ncbi:MAG: signal peptidase [Acidimicrobiaceae bacterium]|jgi:signal peptidase
MRRRANVLGWVALVLVLGGWFALLRPPALGGGTELVIVRGDSMRPTFQPGDLIVTHRSENYSTGEVVTYKVAGGEARVIHRIVDNTAAGFTTQGDNRTSKDPWTPQAQDITGRAVLRIPRIGALPIYLSQSPVATATLAGLAAFLVTIWPDVKHVLSMGRSWHL